MNQATRNLLVIATLSLLVLMYSIYKRDQVLSDGSRIEADKLSFSSLPHFEAENLYTGKTVDSAKLEAGQELIIHFFASWCAPCLVELPTILELAKNKRDKNFILIAVRDQRRNLFKILPQKSISKNILILFDSDASLLNLFGSERIPESYFFDRNKKIKFKTYGVHNWLQD